MEKADNPDRLALLNVLEHSLVEVAFAEMAFNAFDSRIENNSFDSLHQAEMVLTDRFEEIASEACGDSKWGKPEYIQQFMVDGELYEAKVEVDYNRHDKRWYYVDGTKYSYRKL